MTGNLAGNERLDVGFCEADIIASMEESAQDHIKWIYDCLMAKMDREIALRMKQSDRKAFLEKAGLIYQGYVRAIILERTV